jgi:hypothetical protein
VDEVGNEHGYFKGDAVTKNLRLKALFDDMSNGRFAEKKLEFKASNNTCRFADTWAQSCMLLAAQVIWLASSKSICLDDWRNE